MNTYDVVVIGAGPAGLSAALVLSRALRKVAVVDDGEPRNAPAAQMHGFLSRDGSAPTDLLTIGRAEVEGYGGELIGGRVTGVVPHEAEIGTGFRLTLADGSSLNSRQILVATGLQDELPNIPGVRERWGRDVLHCPYCHGYEVRDQPIGVLGGNADSIQHAQLIRQWSPDVMLFPHADSVTAQQREQLAARSIQVIDGLVSQMVVSEDRLNGVELVDARVIARTAVFVRPRFVPNIELVDALKGAIDDHGWVVTDDVGRTSIRGVWVAGNAANARAQVVTAAGEGSASAIAMNAELVGEDINRVIARTP